MPKKTNFKTNGSSYYRVTATIGKDPDGVPIRKQFYGSSKKEAESKRDEYMNGINKGLAVGFDKLMFLPAFLAWFEECCRPNVSKSTFIRYEATIRLHIKPFECLNMRLADIKGLDLQKYYNQLYETKTLSQIECVHCLLSSFFKYALMQDLIVKNPMVSITLKKDDTVKKEIEVFTKDEISKIIASSTNKIEHLIFYFALATGLRLGEILALQHEDIDLAKNTISVSKSIRKMTYEGERIQLIKAPKSKSGVRVVPISEKLIPYINKHILSEKQKHFKLGIAFSPASPFFSSATCNYREAGSVQESLRRFLRRIGVANKKFHTFRHTFWGVDILRPLCYHNPHETNNIKPRDEMPGLWLPGQTNEKGIQ